MEPLLLNSFIFLTYCLLTKMSTTNKKLFKYFFVKSTIQWTLILFSDNIYHRHTKQLAYYNTYVLSTSTTILTILTMKLTINSSVFYNTREIPINIK